MGRKANLFARLAVSVYFGLVLEMVYNAGSPQLSSV